MGNRYESWEKIGDLNEGNSSYARLIHEGKLRINPVSYGIKAAGKRLPL